MDLQPGDCVRIESGEIGKVVHVSRLTVFVALAANNKTDSVKAFLESQLTKVPPPCEPDAPFSPPA
jgi:preprotein translocase subunit YajC